MRQFGYRQVLNHRIREHGVKACTPCVYHWRINRDITPLIGPFSAAHRHLCQKLF